MILAAGRGDRMRPLTDLTPKPLLIAGGKPLIQRTIEQLVMAGFNDIVINIAHLGHQIKQSLGDGSQFNANIVYSDEGETGLETAGGIINALPLLGDDTFLVVNADIAHNYDFAPLQTKKIDLAHLVLIPNPEHHPEGDFHLPLNGIITTNETPKLTYSGIGLYHPQLFTHITVGKIRLAPILRAEMANKRISGEKFNGFWMDIGIPERLVDLNDYYHTHTID